MNILITGGRSPYTLELIRLFGKSGHKVISVEFLYLYLSRFSKYVHKSYIISSPVNDFKKFQTELLEIIDSEKIDLVVPTCEEIFHVSKIKNEIEKKTKVFFEDISLLRLLHSKIEFIKFLSDHKLNHPETFVLSEYSNELKGKKVVLKKEFSRFASNVFIVHESEVEQLNLIKKEWVIQEFVEGQEGSIYVLINQGEVCAYSCYLKKYSIDGGATVLFSHYDGSEILDWLKTFIKVLPGQVTGQYSFDFILNKEKEVFPIECNPRPTSGIHLFSDKIDITKGFLNPITTMQPDKNVAMMLGLAMVTYGVSPKKIFVWGREFLKAKDVIYSKEDLVPFFTQYISFLYFIHISFVKKIKVIEATTIDIEYNG